MHGRHVLCCPRTLCADGAVPAGLLLHGIVGNGDTVQRNRWSLHDWHVLSERVCAANRMPERDVLRVDGTVCAIWVLHCGILLHRQCNERDTYGWRDGECVPIWHVLSSWQLDTHAVR